MSQSQRELNEKLLELANIIESNLELEKNNFRHISGMMEALAEAGKMLATLVSSLEKRVSSLEKIIAYEDEKQNDQEAIEKAKKELEDAGSK